jgi:tryptophan-rich sensory protein
VTKAAWVAAAVCIAAAALEGLFAGRDVKKRLGELRQPPLSPPFGVWVAIGLCYYVICFLVLLRLLESRPSPLRGIALATVALLLIGNAVWNLVFFRRRSLEGAAMVSLAYAALALLVAVLLLQVDPVSARIFVPYLIYLAYGTWWVLALRRLNR